MTISILFASLEQIESWVELTCDRTRDFLDISFRDVLERLIRKHTFSDEQRLGKVFRTRHPGL